MSELSMIQIQKMVFVFNAVLAGWSVRMVDNDMFEFSKDATNQEVNLEEYLRRFVAHNLSIDCLNHSQENSSLTSKE
jgi:hypothetical protein